MNTTNTLLCGFTIFVLSALACEAMEKQYNDSADISGDNFNAKVDFEKTN